MQTVKSLINKENNGDWTAFKNLVKLAAVGDIEAVDWAINLDPEKEGSRFHSMFWDWQDEYADELFTIAGVGNTYAWELAVYRWKLWNENGGDRWSCFDGDKLFRLGYKLGCNGNKRAMKFFGYHVEKGSLPAVRTLAEECEKENAEAINYVKVLLDTEICFVNTAAVIFGEGYTSFDQLFIEKALKSTNIVKWITKWASWEDDIGQMHYVVLKLALAGNVAAIEWLSSGCDTFHERINDDVLDVVFEQMSLGNKHALKIACRLLKNENELILYRLLNIAEQGNLAVKESLSDWIKYSYNEGMQLGNYSFEDFADYVYRCMAVDGDSKALEILEMRALNGDDNAIASIEIITDNYSGVVGRCLKDNSCLCSTTSKICM